MRLPIRVRLTAGYVAVLAAILVTLATFLVLQLGSDLQAALDRDVRQSGVHIARGYSDEGAEDFRDASRTALPGTGLAQVIGPDGRVLHRFGAPASAVPLLPVAVRAAALRGHTTIRTIHLGGDRTAFRAVALPVRRFGRAR